MYVVKRFFVEQRESTSMSKATNKAGREPLNQSIIVSAALELADENGVGSLTMRRLAERLGYEVMSLYNHVANKAELTALMVEAVAREVERPESTERPLDAIRAFVVSIRAVLVRHPWATDLWLRVMPGPERIDQMELLLRLFGSSGLSPELAHHGFHAVNNHVLGYTLQEMGMSFADADPQAAMERFVDGLDPDRHANTLRHVHQHLDGNTASSFELVLDLILDGLVRLDRERRVG